MAVLVWKNAFVSVDGTELTDHTEQVTYNYTAEALDNTAMGATTRTKQGGLKVWDFTVNFFQDYASGSVDATLFPLVGSSTIALLVRPTTAAESATNPTYSGTALLESYQPAAGKVGAMAMTQAKFSAAGDLSQLTS